MYKFVRKLNWSKKVHRNGADFTILIKDGMGMMNFISNYENWLDKILPKLIVKEDAVFVDIGANIGQTMIKVLPRFPGVRYYAVEPNERCVAYLKALCAVNKFEHVKIFECALSESEGKAELATRYQDDVLATTTHSFRKFTKYATRTKVNMTTGDALLKGENLAELAVIKIDIEGGESAAINGLLTTIANFRPYIICEINPLHTEDEGVTAFRTMSANKIFTNLHHLNYTAINIVTKEEINSVEDLSSSLESCNYLFLPKERINLLNLN